MNLIFLEKLFVGHVFLYVTLFVFVIAVFAEMFAYAAAKNALRESENVSSPKKNWLKQIKQRYIFLHKTGSAVMDIDVFLERQLEKSGIGISPNIWNRIAGISAVVCVVCSFTEGMLAVLFEAERINIFVPFASGLWAAVLIMVISYFADTAHKYRIIKNNIKNYFENDLYGRINKIRNSASTEAAVTEFLEKEAGALRKEEKSASKNRQKGDKRAEKSRQKEEIRTEKINKKWQELEMKKAQKQQKKMAKLKKKLEKVQNSFAVPPEIERVFDTPENKRREQKEALLAECGLNRRRTEAEDNKIITEVLNEFLT